MVTSGEDGVKRRKSKPKPEANRRGRATRLARLVPPLARKAYRRRGFVNDEALAHWAEIVGEELAQTTVPLRLRFGRGARRGGILELRVEPAVATAVQHRSEEIRARLNRYFGYEAVSTLRLVQGSVEERRKVPATGSRQSADSESQHRIVAERLTKDIEDDRLRCLLSRWGAEILDSDES